MNVERDPGLLIGVLGMGVLQVVGLYNQTAPSLKELRKSNSDDPETWEALFDADIVIGGASLVVILVACASTKSLWPALLLGGGLGFTMYWHHLVRQTPSINERLRIPNVRDEFDDSTDD